MKKKHAAGPSHNSWQINLQGPAPGVVNEEDTLPGGIPRSGRRQETYFGSVFLFLLACITRACQLDCFYLLFQTSLMSTPLPYCVYILFSEKDHLLYIGFTTNIKNRLENHIDQEHCSPQAVAPNFL